MHTIHPIVVEPYKLSDAAKKLFDELNAAIAGYTDEASKCDAERERIRSKATSELTASDVRRGRELAEQDFDLKRQAHALLKRIKAEWLPLREHERGRYRRESFDAEQAAFEEVKAKLIGIGYDAATIIRDTIARHPRARQAIQELQDAQSFGSFSLSGADIDAQLLTLGQDLESAKKRLLSV
jgi:hypothetical protein